MEKLTWRERRLIQNLRRNLTRKTIPELVMEAYSREVLRQVMRPSIMSRFIERR
jgi:hypothetical protein